ncbi:hypothetical protein EMIT0158MI4_30042 [Burkholderia ambifaria]
MPRVCRGAGSLIMTNIGAPRKPGRPRVKPVN